jgi:hypothetical protein
MVPELSNVVGASASSVIEVVAVVEVSLEQPTIISNNIIDTKYFISFSFLYHLVSILEFKIHHC